MQLASLLLLCLSPALHGPALRVLSRQPSRVPPLTAVASTVATPSAPPPAPLPAPPERLLNEYEELRTAYDRAKLVSFFAQRPQSLIGRMYEFLTAYKRLERIWEDPEGNRGERLREEIAKLGPVAVKLGQTLSQRPDLLADDVCEELKSLQTANTPFEDEQAFRVIREELGWEGPIAPGVGDVGAESGAPTLFKFMTAEPIACASLGQVYRGTTHNGTEIAIKVQRPAAVRQVALAALATLATTLATLATSPFPHMAGAPHPSFLIWQVALDFAVLASSLSTVQFFGWGNGDLAEIVDHLASGVFEELDYRIEAKNAAAFKESLAFLGYVDVPRTLDEYSPGARVIVTEWVAGRHLDRLTQEEGLRMTYMAVEAVTASLVVTGFVHADPHEGNLMLHDDGRWMRLLRLAGVVRMGRTLGFAGLAGGCVSMCSGLWVGGCVGMCSGLRVGGCVSMCLSGELMLWQIADLMRHLAELPKHWRAEFRPFGGRLTFLDFGLMSKVEPEIMEAFAAGIQAVLNKDYETLVEAFIKTGFVGTPIQWRESVEKPFVDQVRSGQIV